LIGIDEKGGITIVECKLASNTEIRRKVIGQVLEYAAYLWQMDYEQFDTVCCKAEKWKDKHLVDAVPEKMDKEPAKAFSEEEFKSNVTSALEQGNFRLIIAVDVLNDELRRIIQFLNSRGESSPQIHALEMRQFETAEFQMLVPELFGTPPPEPKGKMDEAKFLRESSEIGGRLYSRLKELARREEFKTTDFTGRGFALRLYKHGNLFVLYPNRLEMWFGPGYPDDFLDKETDREFWSKVSQITVFRDKMDRKNPEVVVSNDTWEEGDVDMFVSALELLGSRMR
jgi:hypothetical protein